MKPDNAKDVSRVTPESTLLHLNIEQLQPSRNNPRQLFDPAPLATLKKSIQEHGVLVPLTVYRQPGQRERYAIVDGERRFRCCKELAQSGTPIRIPANVVAAPKPIESLIYMFNIHQFRQQWELMPTAIALKSIIDSLKTDSSQELIALTGLGEQQIERCKVILNFPEKYRKMSMDPDPSKRIPSNFWVELYPVLQLSKKLLPDLVRSEGRDGIIDRLVKKYQEKKIKSVIHFRRILEAYEVHEDSEDIDAIRDTLREYILDPTLETRAAFDRLISDNRQVQRAVDAVDKFLTEIKKAKIEHETDRKDELIEKLTNALSFVKTLLGKLEGDDPPDEDEG